MITLLISAGSLLHSFIWIVVIALIFWLLWWLLAYMKVPEPFNKVLKVALAVMAVLILINFLLTLAGQPFIVW